MVTLIHALRSRGLKRGIASPRLGGGEATAVAIEVDWIVTKAGVGWASTGRVQPSRGYDTAARSGAHVQGERQGERDDFHARAGDGP